MNPNDRRPSQQSKQSIANRQNHVLADLRNRYGEKMIELGAQDLSNDSKLLSLIRSIFSGYFDFQTYGQYIGLPSVLDGLSQLANNYLIQSTIHYYATEYLQWNQEALANLTMPINCIRGVCNKDRDVMNMWEIVVEGLNSVRQNNGNIMGLQSAVTYALNCYCSDGRTPLFRML